MPLVKPQIERHTCQNDGLSLVISIPSQKNFFTLIFLAFWLVGWAIGEIIVGGPILVGIMGILFKLPQVGSIKIDSIPAFSLGGLFLLAWLGGWTVGGIFAFRNFFWQLVGKEIIEIDPDSIKVRRTIFGFGRTYEYSATVIKDLRVAPLSVSYGMFGRPRTLSFWSISYDGLLAFDYGSRTIRIGSGIEEAESKQVLYKIISRFPQYLSRASNTA